MGNLACYDCPIGPNGGVVPGLVTPQENCPDENGPVNCKFRPFLERLSVQPLPAEMQILTMSDGTARLVRADAHCF